MKSWLVALSIGPVQDFIASARRTRDLYFGSFLLSEVSKAVACSLKAAGARLIFPDPEMDLAPKGSVDSPNVANVILAELLVSSAEEARDLAEKAKEAAQRRWMDFVDEAWAKSKNLLNEERWNAQKNRDVLEVYAAWAPMKNESDYAKARNRVMKLLAASKNTRCFEAWQGWPVIENSSLDGLRESVLDCGSKRGQARESMVCGDVTIKKNEALDLIGMVKRCLGEQAFPPLSRVALDPWIRGVMAHEKGEAKLHEYAQLCQELVKLKALAPVAPTAGYEVFPCDGAALLADRLDRLVSETDESHKDAVKVLIGSMKSKLRELTRLAGEPDPYVAFIVADGDRMGAAISDLSSADEHRKLSETLSGFAKEAKDIVKNHRGMTIYAGGDDVVACVPLDQALSCARKLHDCFGSLWKDWTDRLEKVPTLSVGISVAHCLENMADLLDFGRQAEGMAKRGLGDEDRNGLAVVVRARNNSEMTLREQWKTLGAATIDGASLDERIGRWVDLFDQRAMPMKLPYELRERALFYRDWPGDCAETSDDERKMLCSAMLNDGLMILNRKELDLTKLQKQELEAFISARLTDTDTTSTSQRASSALKDIATELMVSQWFLSAAKQAKGPGRGGKNHV